MPETTDVLPKENRQQQIENLDIGETISISRRIILQQVPEGAIKAHMDRLRGVADRQTHRARQRRRENQYTTEIGSFITRDGAMILVCAITRLL